jgi:hypothetical protein
MATKSLTLKGIIDSGPEDRGEELRQLRRDNQRLDESLRQVRNELGQAIAEKEVLERSVRALRNQLAPLHHALRAVFGEIELAVGEEEVTHSAPGAVTAASNGADSRWESFKQRFPGVRARIIDALLAHQEMTIVQLSAFIKAAYTTTKDSCAELVKVGALARKGKALRLNR